MRKSKTYNAILLLLFIIMFLAGLFFSSSNLMIVIKGIKTEGTVVDSYCPNNSCKSRIVNISYVDSSGSSHQITEIGTLFPLYNKGDKTVVYYDKYKPDNSVNFSGFTFIMPGLFLVLLLLPIFGLISLFKTRNVNR